MEHRESLSAAIRRECRRWFLLFLNEFFVFLFAFVSFLWVVYALFLSLKTRVSYLPSAGRVFTILYADIDFVFYYHNK